MKWTYMITMLILYNKNNSCILKVDKYSKNKIMNMDLNLLKSKH